MKLIFVFLQLRDFIYFRTMCRPTSGHRFPSYSINGFRRVLNTKEWVNCELSRLLSSFIIRHFLNNVIMRTSFSTLRLNLRKFSGPTWQEMSRDVSLVGLPRGGVFELSTLFLFKTWQVTVLVFQIYHFSAILQFKNRVKLFNTGKKHYKKQINNNK